MIARRGAVLPLDHGGPTDRPFTAFPAAALDAPLVARFLDIAARYPDRVALADDFDVFTYAELGALVARIAAALPRRTAAAAPIGLLLDHDCRFPAAMLGVLASGNGYVPLDAGYPAERTRAIAAHAGVAAIVTTERFLGRARGLVHPGIPILSLDSLPPATIPADALPTLRPDAAADDLASILYTSGSTGEPKGVFQSQRGVLHDVLQYVNAVHITPDDRLTLLYSPATAGAVRDIWGALLTGASLHVIPPRGGIESVADALRRIDPTIYHSVPVLMRHLSAWAGRNAAQFAGVRLGYIAGDRLDAGDVRAFFTLFPAALLYTGLGATEASTIYVHRFIRPDTILSGERVPVGGAMPERSVHLLDGDDNEVPTGEIGEIVVASPYVAQGYWRAAQTTAARFYNDPQRPGWRRFRTGDLGRIRPEDGLLEHHGRADDMVKIGGHRVELAAVEAALKALPGIRDAAALVRPRLSAATEPVLVAYCQPSDETLPDEEDLRAALGRALPPAMVPAELISCPALPLLSNFKIDRAALRRADAERMATALDGAADDPAGNALAQVIAAEIGRLLRLNGAVRQDQNLFALGMDSIAVIELGAALQRRLGRPAPLDVIVAERTPERIAARLAATLPVPAQGSPALVLLRRGEEPRLPPLLWPHEAGGHIPGRISAFLPLLDADRDWFGLRDVEAAGESGGSGVAATARAATDTLELHAERLVGDLVGSGWPSARGAVPIGLSFCGRLAWEVGRQLNAAGWYIPCVIALDAPPFPSEGAGPDLERFHPDRRTAVAHHARLAARYQAMPAPLRLILLRADQSYANSPEDLGWSAVASDVTVVRVRGGHNMFAPERIHETAAALRKALSIVAEAA
jgi:amino acid adenylation domain-containing protein